MTERVPHYWLEYYWAEEDITFYFELSRENIVLRQVELESHTRRARTAANLNEVAEALRTGGPDAVVAYERRFGTLADQPLHGSDVNSGTPISRVDFERVWRDARKSLK